MGKRFTILISLVIATLMVFVMITPAMAGRKDRRTETERYPVLTEDGVELIMKRYRPDSTARFRTWRQPVILAPGILCNFNIFDVHTHEGEHYNPQLPSQLAGWARWDRYIEQDPIKYYSLAHYLWNRGYDVWLFNYRGEGRGEYTSKGAGGYSLDDLGIYDVPAAVEKVYEVTRRHPVWCGHSMGASMAIIYLQGMKYENGPGSHVYSDPSLVAERNGGRGKQALKGFIDLDGPMGSEGGGSLDYPPYWQAMYHGQYLDLRGIVITLGEFAAQPILIFGQVIWWFFALLGYPNLQMANALLSINPFNMDAEVMRFISKYILDGTSTHTFAQLQDAHFRSNFREYYLNSATEPVDTYPPEPFPGDGYYYYTDNLDKITLPSLTMADATLDLTNPKDIENFYLGKGRHALDTFYHMNNTAHIDLVTGLNAPTDTFPKIGEWLRSLRRRWYW